jgi:hypothetical protein
VGEGGSLLQQSDDCHSRGEAAAEGGGSADAEHCDTRADDDEALSRERATHRWAGRGLS